MNKYNEFLQNYSIWIKAQGVKAESALDDIGFTMDVQFADWGTIETMMEQICRDEMLFNSRVKLTYHMLQKYSIYQAYFNKFYENSTNDDEPIEMDEFLKLNIIERGRFLDTTIDILVSCLLNRWSQKLIAHVY